MVQLPSLEAAGRTRRGLLRAINQDVFALYPDLGLYIVIDGMGGHAAGELAAAIAAETIQRFYEEHGAGWPEGATTSPRNPKRLLLVAAIEHADAAIRERATRERAKRGMGAAIAAIDAESAGFCVAHVGHVRAYRWRDQRLQRLTEDHTMMNEYLWRGLPFDLAERRADSSALSRALGRRGLDISVQHEHAEPEDVVLLCSNGVYDALSDLHIARILSGRSALQETADALITGAQAHGAPDDVTCVLLRWGPERARGTAA